MRLKAKDANEEVVEIEESDAMSIELSDEELAALKKLLPHADKLVALVEKDTETEDDESTDPETEEEVKDDENEEPEEKEEKEESVGDSFKSVGAIHNKKPLKDSQNAEIEVDNAWAKRYKGGK